MWNTGMGTWSWINTLKLYWLWKLRSKFGKILYSFSNFKKICRFFCPAFGPWRKYRASVVRLHINMLRIFTLYTDMELYWLNTEKTACILILRSNKNLCGKSCLVGWPICLQLFNCQECWILVSTCLSIGISHKHYHRFCLQLVKDWVSSTDDRLNMFSLKIHV